MPVIYNVFIVTIEKEDYFRIAWHKRENNFQNYFTQEPEITERQAIKVWTILIVFKTSLDYNPGRF